ncbi:hypothetical protein [Sutcliffiella rhizosphaerae]|uniref:Uncharacterized protein n=1 Tax=Sutcliffiella rhizosphaerae TaxID=2880967 RepID=A0ABN8AG78_9BACI|nr:hypothetical protein [Sutcliffiella rhizosphaerae]CAG9621865.1 hypothetical protein BACCIP111883_02656 [Sutcliffiella rhizosphaerae]
MQNIIESALKVLGFIIIIIGLFVSIIAGEEAESISVFFSTFISGVVSGLVLFGLAEIIRLLESINGKLKSKDDSNHATSKEQEEIINGQPMQLSHKEETEIYIFFKEQNKKIDKILPTPREDFFIILSNDEYLLVELGGFSIKVYQADKWPNNLRLWFEANKDTLH